ncbi:protein tramtrack, alpha isoform isoform X1 [Eurosta solidaginis]|uniref:protein tramtrack, alpha isoform isoform X1 n=1 Tax=Eurosta solidaginis TaxID=178769 RepID=UPI003530DCE1
MKMASQRFCLRWNNHQSNLLSVFDQLLHAETFTDVTLAVDGQYLKAHKMVLSACSPYFNALFINHPEKHPIVILKDVPYSDMKSLLDFMYRGEVSVDQERLTAFLRVAESLRIKGLTEVNDDKPSPVTPTPPPPQLQRIQPYLVQQQQHQRSKSQNNLLAGSTSAGASGQHAQQQQSLLSSALASMPKRKRGRPRKLSGSSNGTGNDYDEYEREGMNDSEMGDCKMGDSYSGNDDGSDDNQRDGDLRDPSESRDSAFHNKKFKSKDNKPKQNDNDISTSVQLINTSPELSQRLFGLIKPAATVQPQQQQSSQNDAMQSDQAQVSLLQFNDPQEVITNLPAALGLKVRKTLQLTAPTQQSQQNQQQKPQHQQQQQNNTQNTNSLLKQQLRAGPKEISNTNNTTEPMSNPKNTDFSCAALQSLASVAERQTPNAIQPPSANNLHHQFLLHMAANPMLKPGADFFRQQQQQHQAQQQREQEQLNAQEQEQQQSQTPAQTSSQPTKLLEQEYQNEESMSPTNMDLILDQTDKSEPELMLVDETAGFDYKNADTSSVGNVDDSAVPITTITISDTADNENSNANRTNDLVRPNVSSGSSGTTSRRPVQRRRIRRKAQSTLDDQAEHLTEMSVRGLDLFRYARINEGVYQCTECAKDDLQKTFKNKYSFQRHAFLYHEGKVRKVFPCTLCGKEFSRPDKMKNHLKMAHENCVARDTSGFNPINYLISAATAEEMQTTIFTASAAAQQQQQQQQQQLQQQQIAQLQQQQQRSLSMHDDYMDNTLSILSAMPQERDHNSRPTSPTPAAALLKLRSDLTIKNEIVISPSPSPEPIMTVVPANANVPKSTNSSMLQAKRITQRLEEVK